MINIHMWKKNRALSHSLFSFLAHHFQFHPQTALRSRVCFPHFEFEHNLFSSHRNRRRNNKKHTHSLKNTLKTGNRREENIRSLIQRDDVAFSLTDRDLAGGGYERTSMFWLFLRQALCLWSLSVTLIPSCGRNLRYICVRSELPGYHSCLVLGLRNQNSLHWLFSCCFLEALEIWKSAMDF